MFGDAITLATNGQSIGELLRQNANSVVLAHLQQGYNSLHVAALEDGTPIVRSRTVQDVLIEMSTGGVLFGDPAFVPFTKKFGARPVELSVKRRGESVYAALQVAGPLYHFFCGDQIIMWEEGKPSLRLETRVPLNDQYLADVRLASSTLGDVPHRLVAAQETHRGKQFAYVKASFEQPSMDRLMQLAQSGLSGTFEIKTVKTPAEASMVRREEAR